MHSIALLNEWTNEWAASHMPFIQLWTWRNLITTQTQGLQTHGSPTVSLSAVKGVTRNGLGKVKPESIAWKVSILMYFFQLFSFEMGSCYVALAGMVLAMKFRVAFTYSNPVLASLLIRSQACTSETLSSNRHLKFSSILSTYYTPTQLTTPF